MDAVVRLSRVDFDAVVLDLHGVVTDAASHHEKAWNNRFHGADIVVPDIAGIDVVVVSHARERPRS